jgi:hypothetical protein
LLNLGAERSLLFFFLQTDLAIVGKNTTTNSQLTAENVVLPNELTNKVLFFTSDIFKILILNQHVTEFFLLHSGFLLDSINTKYNLGS